MGLGFVKSLKCEVECASTGRQCPWHAAMTDLYLAQGPLSAWQTAMTNLDLDVSIIV